MALDQWTYATKTSGPPWGEVTKDDCSVTYGSHTVDTDDTTGLNNGDDVTITDGETTLETSITGVNSDVSITIAEAWTGGTGDSAQIIDSSSLEQVYTEYEESGDGQVSADDSFANIVYQVDDGNRIAFLDDLIGYSTYVNEAGGNLDITRVLPQQHPEFDNFYCVSASWRRFGKASQVTVGTNDNVGAWQFSRINATFRPLEYAVVADDDLPTITLQTDPFRTGTTAPNELARYVTRRYNYVIQYLSLQEGAQGQPLMQWVSRTSNKGILNPPGFAVSYLEKEITWHQVPARTMGGTSVSPQFEVPNSSTIQLYAGMCNSFPFDGHPAGSVLFAGVQPTLRKPVLDTGLYS